VTFLLQGPDDLIGQCGRQNFSQMARDSSGRAFFDLVVRDVIEGPWEDKLLCGWQTHRAHWNIF